MHKTHAENQGSNRFPPRLCRRGGKRFFSPNSWLFGLVLCLPLQAFAQNEQHYFHHLTPANGLSQSINAFVSRDSRGFAWISSTDGLNRFDGAGVRVYRSDLTDPRALYGANIQSRCFEDSKGDLWFCTYEAIHRYRRATDDFEHFFIVQNGRELRQDYYVFHLDGAGFLWVKNDRQLFLLDTRSVSHDRPQEEWLRYAGSISGLRCLPVADAETGRVEAILTYSMREDSGINIYRVAGDSLRLAGAWLNGRGGQPTEFVWDIAPGGEDSFWLATDNGLLLWNLSGAQFRSFNRYQNRRLSRFRGLAKTPSGSLYVSSNEGLWLFDPGPMAFRRCFTHDANDIGTLTSDSPRELYLDSEQNLWVSFWTIGVDFANLRKNKFTSITIPNPAGDPAKPPFVPEVLAQNPVDGSVWCGSHMSGLCRLSAGGAATKYCDNPRVVNALLTLPTGQLLVNDLYGGVCCFDLRAEKPRPVRQFGGEAILLHSMLAVPGGPIAGSVSEGPGLMALTPRESGFRAEPVRHPLLDTMTLENLYQDRNGRFYFEADGVGLLLMQGPLSGLQLTQTIPFDGEAKCFAENDTAVWVGGDFGLLRVNKQNARFQFIGEKEGLPDRTVYGCLFNTREDQLWLSTNQGLVRYLPTTGIFRRYTPADGLQALEFNTRSYLRTPDGRLWFGGIGGLNVFHPDSIADLGVLPHVQITGLRVNDQPFAPDSNLTELRRLILPYDSSTISFEFVALEFSDPARNRLKYRLEYADGAPYDKEWVACEDARGFARYAKLQPGRYKFQVMGANSDGVWNPGPRVIFITITPPFWQTWWFRMLVAALLLGISYAAVRRYVRDKLRRRDLEIREKNLKIEKQEALTQERNRIAGEMHDDLGGGLTAIRMLSERVQNKIEHTDTRGQVDKIARYSQELVQKMGEIIWAMNSNFDTVESLVAYIRRYAVEYLEINQLRAVLREPEVLPDAAISGERRRNLYLAVKESLHNIVKHAGAERVNISFRIDANRLVIEVADDGRGIDPDQLNRFGNGLSNMRRRLLDIGGDLQIANDDGARLTFTAPFETPDAAP